MAKKIMIQGTMSNAGKSILVTALCRIFKEDGYLAAPFKSQNMALNSYITEDGLEMGRAQVVQAEAAGIKPCVQMNPILLKPTDDMGSQVIVNGEVIGNMKAIDYFEYKRQLIPDIKKAYQYLDSKYDIIVIEGAGSPAEINLKQEDIVNMGLAQLVDAPVFLVGDIDRGGVFAQIFGTIMLLEESEKKRIKGIFINKFRGDKEILKPGIKQLEELCSLPVSGVIPYMNLDIDDEDSLSERLFQKKEGGILDIAVIKLPYLSNFTDFNPLERRKEINLRYVTQKYELKRADLIIIPGSKNTISDLLWMRKNGIETEIKKQAKEGKIILGICGGYQMLGKSLYNTYEMELAKSEEIIDGIGLLPVHTIFKKQKIRTRMKGVILETQGVFHSFQGIEVDGYEIHTGVTKQVSDISPFLTLTSLDGMQTKQEGCGQDNIYGTYLHGFFDSDRLTEKLMELLLKRKGLEGKIEKEQKTKKYKEEQYHTLANIVRKNIDLEFIYHIMKENEREEKIWS